VGLVSDTFGRVQVLVTLFVLGAAGLFFWETRHASPIVNFQPLRGRNLRLGYLYFQCSKFKPQV
jgi:hypothetical protein